MMRGHVLLPSMMTLKLQPIQEKINPSDILISSMVMNQLDVTVGMTVYLTTIFEDATKGQSPLIPLTIIGVIQESLPLIYQHSLWYSFYLMEMMHVPSHELIPQGYAVYGKSIDVGVEDFSYHPLMNVQLQLKQWQQGLMFLICAALFIFGLPSFMMFYSQFDRFMVASIPSLKTMIALGGSIPMMIEFTMVKLDLVGIEIILMTFIGFLLIDIEMKRLLLDFIFLPTLYRIPWIELLSLILILVLLRFAIKSALNKKIQKLLVFN
jgi:hypothetical protein